MAYVLLLGGARSGKSRLAQEIAHRSGCQVTVIATGQAGDEEMAVRIARHRAGRPAAWTTVEEPIEILAALDAAPAANYLVVDCLTLWVANLLGRGDTAEEIVARSVDVARALTSRSAGAVVVSNEVGLGIVPSNPLTRTYRDTLGSVNSVFAGLADRTALLVAGRIHELSSASGFMEGIRWLPPQPSSN
jgi:adenosylcobinamide kinase / adenosylcobinamide-phosphate guanylyltransferase